MRASALEWRDEQGRRLRNRARRGSAHREWATPARRARPSVSEPRVSTARPPPARSQGNREGAVGRHQVRGSERRGVGSFPCEAARAKFMTTISICIDTVVDSLRHGNEQWQECRATSTAAAMTQRTVWRRVNLRGAHVLRPPMTTSSRSRTRSAMPPTRACARRMAPANQPRGPRLRDQDVDLDVPPPRRAVDAGVRSVPMCGPDGRSRARCAPPTLNGCIRPPSPEPQGARSPDGCARPQTC
jgi:hypothetical protein